MPKRHDYAYPDGEPTEATDPEQPEASEPRSRKAEAGPEPEPAYVCDACGPVDADHSCAYTVRRVP
jgi:hypothetical protein